MNKILKVVVLILVFSSNACAHGKNQHKNNRLFKDSKSAPGKVVQEFHSALRNKDKNLVLKHLDDSVLIYEGGGVERSSQEYESHHLMSDIAFMSKMKVNLIEHQVEIYGDVAISSSRSTIEGKYKGKNIKKTNMETILLKKNKNKWKIIKIHWS
jgi:ketosteroid isomerase-like protein